MSPESATALPLTEPVDDAPESVAEAADGAADAPKAERPLTTFHVLVTSDGGNLWKYFGTIEARDRDRAERVFFADLQVPPEGVTHAFVTEAAWQPATRVAEVTVKTKTEPFTMPAVG